MKLKMLGLLFFSLPVLAAPPRIVNGSVQAVPSLAQAEAVGNGWVGYAIATPKGFSSCGCSLASENNNISRGDDVSPGASTVLLFIRMRDGQADRFRFLSPDCNINAVGQTIGWVDNVSERESVAFLKRIADNGSGHASNGALLALTLQAAGTHAPIDIAHHKASGHVCRQAPFWLSQQAGGK